MKFSVFFGQMPGHLLRKLPALKTFNPLEKLREMVSGLANQSIKPNISVVPVVIFDPLGNKVAGNKI